MKKVLFYTIIMLWFGQTLGQTDTLAVPSTKTSYLVNLPPDRLDSVLWQETTSGRFKGKQLIAGKFVSLVTGINVGQKFAGGNKDQAISRSLLFETVGNGPTSELGYYDLDLYNRQVKLRQLQIFTATGGLAPDLVPWIPYFRLGGGILGYRNQAGYKQYPHFTIDSGFWYVFPGSNSRTLFFSGKQVIAKPFNFQIYKTGYQIYLGNFVSCSFVLTYHKLNTSHQLSVGALVGLWIPSFRIGEKQ